MTSASVFSNGATRLVRPVVVALGLLLLGCDGEAGDWERSQAADTVEAYRSFLEAHPGSEHADDAVARLAVREDERAWERAAASRTIDAVDGYLVAHPDGGFVVEARRTKAALLESRDWAQAEATSSIDALESFLERYPESGRRAEAEGLLVPLREAHDWARAMDANSIEALDAFVSRYPSSEHTDEAGRLLAALREAAAWQAAMHATSPAQVDEFLAAYPDGPHAADARRLRQALYWQHELDADRLETAINATLVAEQGLLRGSGMLLTHLKSEGSRLGWNDVHRNDAVAVLNGSVKFTDSKGGSLTIGLDGIIWNSQQVMQGSYMYSYDTAIGASDPLQFEGLLAQPELDPERPIAVLKIEPGGNLRFQR